MAYAISQNFTIDRGTYNSATNYVAGDGMTYFGLDQVSGVGIRFVAKASNINTPPTLSPTDLKWSLGHAANALQFYNTLIALSKSTPFMGAGYEYEELYRYNALNTSLSGFSSPLRKLSIALRGKGINQTSMVDFALEYSEANNPTSTANIMLVGYESFISPPALPVNKTHTFRDEWASGASYQKGDIVSVYFNDNYWRRFALCLVDHVADSNNFPNSTEGLTFWIFQNTFDNMTNLSDGYTLWGQINAQKSGYHKMWNNGEIPFWIFANGNRLMWVTNSNNRYHYSYAGLFTVYGDTNDYAYPFLISGNFNDQNTAYDDSRNHNFPMGITDVNSPSDFNINSGYAMTRSLHWASLQASGYADSTRRMRCHPFNHYKNDLLIVNENGDYFLEEALLFSVVNPPDSNQGFAGQVDGLFWVTPFGLISGNILTVATDEYIVFEDVYRGNSGGYLAIKKA